MGEEWTIEALPAGAGVDLRLVLPIDSKPVTVVLSLDRAQARAFGRSVLAAAGDGLGQTFPAPVLPPPTRTDV